MKKIVSLSLIILFCSLYIIKAHEIITNTQNELYNKISFLESNVEEKIRELESKDESISQLENIIREKSDAISSLQNDIKAHREKGSVGDKEQRDEARISELETQDAKLKKETEKLSKKRDALESRPSTTEQKVTDLNSKLESALQKKAELHKWAEPHIETVTTKWVPVVKDQSSRLFSQVGPQIKLVTTKTSEVYHASKNSIGPHVVKLQEAVDPYFQEVKKFTKTYIDQVVTVSKPHEQKTRIRENERALQAAEEKGSVGDKEQRDEARISELETQDAKLKKETEKLSKKRDALDSRASTAEQKVTDLNSKLESALQKKAELHKWAEPHIETVTTKWVPVVKDQSSRLFSQVGPQIKLVTTKTSEVYHASKNSIGPHVVKLQEAVYPYFQEVKKFTKPYIDQVVTVSKPHEQKTRIRENERALQAAEEKGSVGDKEQRDEARISELETQDAKLKKETEKLSKKRDALESRPSTAEQKVTDLNSKLESALQKKAELHKWAEPHIETVTTKWVPVVKDQSSRLFSQVGPQIKLVTTKTSEVYHASKNSIGPHVVKLQEAVDPYFQEVKKFTKTYIDQVVTVLKPHEQKTRICENERALQAAEEKGSVGDKEQRDEARISELETQDAKLKKETEKLSKKRDALDSRASTAEQKVTDLNSKLESALQKKAELHKWAEPHIETVTTKWVPVVKDQSSRLFSQVGPQIKLVTTKTSEVYHASKNSIGPHVVKLQEAVYPYFQEVKKFTKPYIDQVVTVSKPHEQKTRIRENERALQAAEEKGSVGDKEQRDEARISELETQDAKLKKETEKLSKKRDALESRPSTAEQKVTDLNSKLESALQKKAELHKWAEPHIETVTTKWVPVVKDQSSRLFSQVGPQIKLVTTKTSEVYHASKNSIGPHVVKLQEAVDPYFQEVKKFTKTYIDQVVTVLKPHEQKTRICENERALQAAEEKGSVGDKEQRDEARISELETQDAKLKKETEKLSKKRDALDSRASTAEQKVTDLNSKLESALQKKAELHKWAEPHIETVTTKWVPVVKDQSSRLFSQVGPQIKLVTTKTSEVYHASKNSIGPHVVKLQEAVDPYFQEVKKFTKTYIDQVVTVLKPHEQKTRICENERALQAAEEKGSVGDKEQRDEARISELETQDAKLKKETEKLSKKRDALDSRASTAEQKVTDLNSKLESALQKKAELHKWAEPHIETMTTKWVPVVKDQSSRLFSQVGPQIKLVTTKTSEVYHASKNSIGPHVVKLQEAVYPYFQEVKKFTKPYIDQVVTVSKPHEQKTRIRENERALQAAEEEFLKAKFRETTFYKKLKGAQQSWVPHWLSIHLLHCQSFISTQWKESGRPMLDAKLQKALQKKAELHKWAEPHIETVTMKWVPVVKDQSSKLFSQVGPQIKLVTTKTSEVYHASKNSIGPHVVKLQEAVDPYFQEVKKFTKPYIDQVVTVSKPHEQKTRIRENERALQAAEEKGSVGDKEQRDEARISELEFQDAKLKKETEKLSKKRDALESRASTAEQKVTDLNSKLESALQKKAELHKWAEPHIETVTTKRVPIVKDQSSRLFSQVGPQIKLVTTKTSELYHASKNSIGPHVVKLQEAVDPYFQEVKKFTKPYIDQVVTVSKPHVDKACVWLKPYTKKISRGYRKFLKALTPYHLSVQTAIREILRNNEFTKPLATEKVVWYAASGFMALPLLFLFNLVSPIRKPKRRSRNLIRAIHDGRLNEYMFRTKGFVT